MAPQTDIDRLLDDVLALSVPLHEAIAAFDEPGGEYRLAGPPGVAFFERDAGNTVTHSSSSPSPALMPAIDDLRRRHLGGAGVADNVDNSHVMPLLLICMFLVDDVASERFHLRQFANKPTEIEALDQEAGEHDPELEPHDAALRVWVPLEAVHAPEYGVHPAILELKFRMQRKSRFAPPT